MSPSRTQVQQPPSATHAPARRTDQSQPSTFSEWEPAAFDPTPALIVQPKLRVSEPGDPYEREADRIASAVAGAFGSPGEVPSASPVGIVHRDATGSGGGGMPVSPAVESAIGSARGGGRPLPNSIREPMEGALSSDLGGVRIHTDPHADALNRSLEARAFTTGRDIFFESGSYSPGTTEGRQLIAHELTHVVQQGGGSGSAVQRSPAASGLIQRVEKKRKRRSFRRGRYGPREIVSKDESPRKRRKLESDAEAPTPIEVEPTSLSAPGFDTSQGLDFAFTPPTVSQPLSFASPFLAPSLPFPSFPIESAPFSGFHSFQLPSREPVESPQLESFELPSSGFFTPPDLGTRESPQLESFEALSVPSQSFSPFATPFSFAPPSRRLPTLVPAAKGFEFDTSLEPEAEEFISSEDFEFSSDSAPESFSSFEEFQQKQALGKAAWETIVELTSRVTDTVELASYFPILAEKFGMQWIKLVDVGTPEARVLFKINPEFEYKLVGSDIEMRSEGSGKGSLGAAAKTRVAWKAGEINIGGSNYVVGKHMLANPLSSDHAMGTKSTADTDQGWASNTKGNVSILPTAKGSDDKGYVKGHLLNDNLGGIANEKNLFPITGYANQQHKNNAEAYIKTGIKNGYVYAYRVDIGNISTGAIPAPSTLNWVDADLYFEFARLDATGKEVKGTHHEGTVKSRYGKREADPFATTKLRQTEYKEDYTGGKPSKPQLSAKGSGGNVEQVSKVKKEASIGTSNAGREVDRDVKGKGLKFKEPDAFGTNPFPAVAAVAPQAINAAAVFEPKLSLKQSTQKTVEDQFANIVTGWTANDIKNWVTELRATPALKTWKDVETTAVKHNLDATIASKIFAAGGEGRYKTTINGAP